MVMSIRRNSFWLLLARLTAQALAVLFTAVIARKLGVNNFGQFSFIASLVLIGNTFSNFGTDTFLVREIARVGRVTEVAGQALGLQLLLSVVYCFAMLAFRSGSLLFYSLALFPLAFFSVNNALLRALNRMDLFWLLSLLNGFIQVLSAFFSSNVLALCIFLFVGQALLSTVSYLVCRLSLPNFSLFPIQSSSPIFKLIFPFAVLTILLVLIQRLGVLSVSALLNNEAVGLFSSITRVVDGLKLGHYAILGALLPALSGGVSGSWNSFRKAFILLMTVSLLFVVGLTFLANPLMLFLYGNDFVQASSLLALLGWSLLPYTISSFISYGLIARGYESDVVKSALFSLLGYAAVNLVLISIAGLRGAIWSVLIGECFQAVVFMFFYFRRFQANES